VVIRSFKIKLVLWFALLALLPLAVAFYGYGAVEAKSVTERTDAGLESALRAAAADYAASLDSMSRRAELLAHENRLQVALRRHDRATLETIVSRFGDVAIDAPGLHVGSAPAVSARRSVAVLAGSRELGRVTAYARIDTAYLRYLGGGLAPGDRLVGVVDGRIVTGAGVGAPLALTPGATTRVEVDGVGYRALRTADLPAPPHFALATLAPQAMVDAAVRSAERRILIGLVLSLLLFGGVTYLLGRSIVRSLRRLADAAHALAQGHLGERVKIEGSDEFAQVAAAFNRMAAQLQQRLDELETERSRLRDATARFGEALVATHDVDQLLRVVVESAVEATGASGGLVLDRTGELARAGDPEAEGERIAFPLRTGVSDFGSLVVSAPSFDTEQVEVAASLAAQAVVALENARLHRIVERQALVDSLTGLANRRSLEETLRAEIARAARHDDSICLVLADLDDFKQVNDRHGHPVGDEVLKEFARALRASVRESDIAGRWGGEEFALVLTGTDSDGGVRLAERARAAIQDSVVYTSSGEAVSVTGSFGVASFPEATNLEELLAAADSALYAAKRNGKNRVVAAAESVAG
jgi:diguanylate cyclase (GGDEF)-like protein